jgi:hypothetical protein
MVSGSLQQVGLDEKELLGLAACSVGWWLMAGAGLF